MLTVQRGSDAWPAGRVRCWQVQCREPKTGQQKIHLSRKTKHFSHLGMIYLWFQTNREIEHVLVDWCAGLDPGDGT